ncbi:hypothetical protein MGYG_02431 [Nannizzia gypsea CBS 118893]|uniref:Phosphoribosyltransferase domain-containing protein n=1 Tax=Arthroderma gypseum (strain ATCC MYA-4604 / CBS 118893) TaxID=535722 RepID=E4URJ9_ARTGP|nr:hypothetical protein MGYG_02431 [Nannizzia gypsea CBS 118893]EFQ99421.1 hypothetical protein MGYG_02431 [Nannizzia gypsea CBS 118893]
MRPLTAQEAHRRVGWYLATEFLAEAVGAEEYSIPHVQGRDTAGVDCCINAWRRAYGSGVSEAFPFTTFLHTRYPNDVTADYLRGRNAVFLVDSVVNSSGSVAQFVRYVLSLGSAINIVIVAGVVHGSNKIQLAAVRRLGRIGIVASRRPTVKSVCTTASL